MSLCKVKLLEILKRIWKADFTFFTKKVSLKKLHHLAFLSSALFNSIPFVKIFLSGSFVQLLSKVKLNSWRKASCFKVFVCYNHKWNDKKLSIVWYLWKISLTPFLDMYLLFRFYQENRIQTIFVLFERNSKVVLI